MKVTALKLRDGHYTDFDTKLEGRWDYADLKRDPEWQEWISFDCCLFVPEQNRLYCGLATLDGNIFWAFDRGSRAFVNCGFTRINSPFDAKFHRSLVRREKDRCLYAATALLHDIDQYWEAPGGIIARYDPTTGELEKLAIPLPHLYIQTICLHQQSDMIFGLTFPPEYLFSFDLKTRTAKNLGPISSGFEMAQGENLEIDDEGCIWSGWGVTRAWANSLGRDSKRLCKYDPKLDKIIYYKTGLANPGSSEYVRLDGLFNLHTGCLFATGGGSLYRVNTASGQVTYLDTPIADRPSRLSSLRLGPDGAAYGVVGRGGHCQVIRVEPKTAKFELLGELIDGEARCWQVHDVAVTPDGTLYACENDHPSRSAYLWEIAL